MSDASPELDRTKRNDGTPPLSRQTSTPKVLIRGNSARKNLDLSVATAGGSAKSSPVPTRQGEDDGPQPHTNFRSESMELYEFLDYLQFGKPVESSPVPNFDKHRSYSNVSMSSMPGSPQADESNLDSAMSPLRNTYGSPHNSYFQSPAQLYSPAPGRYINPMQFGGVEVGTPGTRGSIPIPSPSSTPRHGRGQSSGLAVPQSPVAFKDRMTTPRGEHPDPIKLPEDEQALLRGTVDAMHAHPTGEKKHLSPSGAAFKSMRQFQSTGALLGSSFGGNGETTPSTSVSPLNKGSSDQMELIDLKQKLDAESRWREKAQAEIQSLCEQLERERAEKDRLISIMGEMQARTLEGRLVIEKTVNSLEAKAETERKKAAQAEAEIQAKQKSHETEKELAEDRLRRHMEEYESLNKKYSEEAIAHDKLKMAHERVKGELADVSKCYEECTSKMNQMKEQIRELTQKKQALEIDLSAAEVRQREADIHIEQLKDAEEHHLKIQAELKEAISNKEYKAEKTVRAVTEHLQQTAQEQIARLHTQLQYERERNTRLEHKVAENNVLVEENRRLRRELGYNSPRFPVLLKSPGGDPLTPEQEETIKQFQQTFSK